MKMSCTVFIPVRSVTLSSAKMTGMTDRLNDLELEILDVLCMDSETAELLTEMVAPEGERLTEDAVRSALGSLSARGLVRPLTNTPATYDVHPDWSPDGRWIVWMNGMDDT